MSSELSAYDVTVVGGGHNGLVAAAYLARAGMSVLVLERLDHVGGVAGATHLFPGRGTRFARHSAFLAPLPARVAEELGLDLPRAARPAAAYGPSREDDEHDAWQAFHADVAGLVDQVAPTMLEPLPVERSIRESVDDQVWADLVLRPIGETIERRFSGDAVRGLVAADALVGTFASLHDPSLAQNRTFLHRHLARSWTDRSVPLGGRGADVLARVAADAGAEILTGAGVSRIAGGDEGAEVTWHDTTGAHTVSSRHVLSDVAPWVLRILLGDGEDPDTKPVGSQLSITMLVDRLPALRSGADSATVLGDGLRVGGYADLAQAHTDATAGRVPTAVPGELRAPSVVDAAVLGEGADEGQHLLTFLGLQAPAPLFDHDRDVRRGQAVDRALATIDEHLAEPVRSLLATDVDGNPCLTAAVPQDVEADLATPGGHLFHGDLEWPWAPNRARLETPAQRWGVQTDVGSVLVCGSGARRAGVVAGVGGHHAAQAVLEAR